MDELKIGNELNHLDNQNILSTTNKNNSKNILDFNISNNLNDINEMNVVKENDFKKMIMELEKEIEKEKNKSKDKTEENKNIISEIKQKILNYKKEINKYSIKNDKQREELELFSQQVTNKINSINIINVLKKKVNAKKNKKIEEDEKIEEKQKQLKNIMELIQRIETENESLKYKMDKFKKDKKYDDLIKEKKEQENKIIELQKKIKSKRLEVEEHSKCNLIKNNLMKKLDEIKNEIDIYNEIYEKSVNTINDLENKNKPKIIMKKNIDNNLINARNNKFQKMILSSNTLDDNAGGKICENKDKKNTYKSHKIINNDKEEKLFDIHYNLSNIFNEKELKAIYIGVDKNKSKYINILKILNIKSKYNYNIELRHKIDINSRISKINELYEKIENMNLIQLEKDTDIKLYSKLINDLMEEKKIFFSKNNQLDSQIKEKKIIIERKNKEINSLGEKLIQLKNFLKIGDRNSIKNFPKIEIENEENSVFDDILEEI